MSKYFLLFLLIGHICIAQQKRKNLKELISAETAFAQKANDTSTRTAFLANLDSAGVLFNGGVAVNGIHQYSNAKENSKELLSWYPVTAHVSTSGDMGFTSGPYKYFAERGKEAVASGYFFSIWKRNTRGIFKLLLDGGTSNTTNHERMFEENPKPGESGFPDVKGDASANLYKESPWDSEKKFAKLAESEPMKAWQEFLADSVWTLIGDKHPGKSKVDNLTMFRDTKVTSYDFLQAGQGTSTEMNLAYSYGQVKERSGAGEKSGFYVRVWQFQKEGWRIIADVVSVSSN